MRRGPFCAVPKRAFLQLSSAQEDLSIGGYVLLLLQQQ